MRLYILTLITAINTAQATDPCGMLKDSTQERTTRLIATKDAIIKLEREPGLDQGERRIHALAKRQALAAAEGWACYEQLQRAGMGESPINGE